MARSVSKRLSYMRVVFAEPFPQLSMQEMLAGAIRLLPERHQRECPDQTFGVVALRHSRSSNRTNALLFDLGAGLPGEDMSAMPIGPVPAQDVDAPVPPPANRAFKRAEGFALIKDNEIIICVDHMRVSTAERYLDKLLRKAYPNMTIAFEFRPMRNADQHQVIVAEGVKNLRVNSVVSAASDELNQYRSPRGWFRSALSTLQDLLINDLPEGRDRQVLAENWSRLNVDTVISVKGGTRGEPIVLQAMQAAGLTTLDEAEDGVSLTIETRSGSKIRGSDLALGKSVSLTRNENRSDLNRDSVWEELESYEIELRDEQRWGQ